MALRCSPLAEIMSPHRLADTPKHSRASATWPTVQFLGGIAGQTAGGGGAHVHGGGGVPARRYFPVESGEQVRSTEREPAGGRSRPTFAPARNLFGGQDGVAAGRELGEPDAPLSSVSAEATTSSPTLS